MEFSAENLEYAVKVFYNGEQTERPKAHAWLTSAQRAPQAWNFVWELLQPNKGTEVQFYGATTLHTKILRCWNEVPPESYEELKRNILQAVFAYSKGPKIVTNRLCISLAAFILQQGTPDLATILRPLSTEENSSLLLEVLTVIPEEYASMTMGSVLRKKNRIALQQASPKVLDDMLRYLQSVYNDYSKEPLSEQIIQSWVTAATCANSWLMLSEDGSDITGGTLPDRMPLCRAMLAVVQLLYTLNPLVSDISLDACEACLTGLRTAACAATQHPVSAMQLMVEIAALAEPIVARDNVPNSSNEELICALITCMVSIGECYSKALVLAVESQDDSAINGSQRYIQLLLAVQGAPGYYPIHETRSNFVFGFWYTLQDEVINMQEGEEIHGIWREVFTNLLTILVSKSEAPDDASMSKDDLELLRCYRQDIGDTVMYCYSIIGEACWCCLENAYSRAQSAGAREACLHVFAALYEAAPSQGAPPGLLALLTHALHDVHTAQHVSLLETALDCLGLYAAWMGCVGGAELGRQCVGAAGGALGRAGGRVARAAALALRKLAAYCTKPAADLVPHFVTAAQSVAGCSDAWVRRQLVSAAGAALSAAELDMATPLLQQLAQTMLDDLRIQDRTAPHCAAAAECSAALMSALSPRVPLAADLFRILLPALPPYAEHEALVEALFLLLKATIGSLMEESLPFMSDIARLIVAGFNTLPCSSGTDILRLTVLMLGQDYAGTQAMFVPCVVLSVRALSSDPSAKCDLTEGLFSMLQAVTKKRPQYIDWLEEVLPGLVELACSSVRMWECGGSRAACGWLCALAALRPSVLQPAAPALTHITLSCIGGLTPRNQISYLAELLLALNRASWEEGAELASWLRSSLAAPGFPTVHATEPYKLKFIAAVVKEKSNKRRLLDSVTEFSLVCRGLVDTEYARQTRASKQLVA